MSDSAPAFYDRLEHDSAFLGDAMAESRMFPPGLRNFSWSARKTSRIETDDRASAQWNAARTDALFDGIPYSTIPQPQSVSFDEIVRRYRAGEITQ